MSDDSWRFNFPYVQKLLKDLDAYIRVHDWTNVRAIQNKLVFAIKFYPVYEEERINRLNFLREKESKK